MASVPPDFGGFLCYWIPDVSGVAAFGSRTGPHAVVSRYGAGRAVEGLTLTPLNALQLRKSLDVVIAQGEREGYITEEHLQQSAQLPTTQGIRDIMDRRSVDQIAGED